MILDPECRWAPSGKDLSESGYEKLLPPLVYKIRREVKAWRDTDYEGASPTSKALLNWWFDAGHSLEKSDGELFGFRYYFAQREAVETVIYLYEVAQVKDKYDLIRYDSSGAVSSGMFEETGFASSSKWPRGAEKTKVISLILAWCYSINSTSPIRASRPIFSSSRRTSSCWTASARISRA